jgi:NAD(P)-dependent dehydrogenase (short-subunit alcohol dehydrogenase family)
MESLGASFTAIVLGATGGIGSAVADALDGDAHCARVLRLSRTGAVRFDLTDEGSIARAAEAARAELGEAALIVNATGVLDRHGHAPERSLAALDAGAMAATLAINAIGAALVLKHFHVLLPRQGKSVIASLSARVGSIGDNRLGGWYSYRASKAALNQLVHTAAIEIARKRAAAVCVAVHPGTVATALSAPYARSRAVLQPEDAARKILALLDGLDASHSGGFFAHDGSTIPW